MDEDTCKSKEVYVSLTEEWVMNPSAMPKGLEDWRYYRIEYGGHAESCVKELPIYLPMRADAYILDLLFEFWQAENRAEMAVKAAEIMAVMKEQIRRAE